MRSLICPSSSIFRLQDNYLNRYSLLARRCWLVQPLSDYGSHPRGSPSNQHLQQDSKARMTTLCCLIRISRCQPPQSSSSSPTLLGRHLSQITNKLAGSSRLANDSPLSLLRLPHHRRTKRNQRGAPWLPC